MNKMIFHDFVDAINRHNLEAIGVLMTEDHIFIDAHGNEMKGREKMKTGWKGYFQWFPDYHIEVTDIFSAGDTIAAFGFAGATYQGKPGTDNKNYWRIPAAWKAVIIQGKVKLWQVYADTKIPYDILSSNK